MAIANIWKIHSVVFNQPSDIVVGAMSNLSMSTDSEVVREVNASRHYARQAHQNVRSVGINFTSWHLEELLSVCGIGGLCVGTGLTTTSMDVYVAMYDCNAVASGSVHTMYQINKGLVFPTGISVDHQGNAQITYTILAIYDGTNEPVVKTTNNALPTIATGEDERWTMYDMTFNTVDVTQKKSINIDFGIQTNVDGADSEAYDSWASLNEILPVITVQGIDPDYLGDFAATMAGTTAVHANCRIQLKERGAAIGTASHIWIDYGGLSRVSDIFSSSGNDAGQTELRIECLEVGANAPLVITTDSIIS